MTRLLVGLLVVAHGFVTGAMWGPRYPATSHGRIRPPNPAHSWLLGDARLLSLIAGIAVGFALAVAGVGFLADRHWWPAVGVIAGVASLLLYVTFFDAWWTAGILISSGLVLGALLA